MFKKVFLDNYFMNVMNENNGSLKPVWRELTRKGKNLPVLLVSEITRSLPLVPMVHGFEFQPKRYRQFDCSRWVEESDYEAWQNALREKEERKPGWLFELMCDFEETIKEFKATAEKISRAFAAAQQPGGASNEQLTGWFEAFMKAGAKTIAYDYDYNFLNNFYVDPLFAEIAGKEKNVEKQNEFLKTLLSPDEFSDTNNEKRGLLEIARKIAASAPNEEIKRAAEAHAARFAYMGMFYFERAPLTPSDVIERARHLAESGVSEEEARLKNQALSAKKSREIMDALRLSKGARLRVKTLKKTSFETNFFDESWNYACFKIQPLLHEIACRLGISYAQLIELTEKEVEDALASGEISKELKREATERAKDHVLLIEGNRVESVLTGAALAAYREKEKSEANEAKPVTALESRELRGLCASPGKARGRVRILLRPEEIPLLQKGEVLVAKMTAPSFVPAMEKACALVAEQGGLLCHTAIVGRELGVPTVVGVKNATLALKNGDLVEVDATNGIVRKVS